MRRLGLSILLWTAAGTCGFAQQWEFGGSAGGSFLNNVAVTGASGSATAGFKPGVAAGAFFGQNLYSHLAGELHYGFLQSNLRLESGGSEATFSGVAHVLHYDLILRTNHAHESKAQLFGAFGGGMKIFRGTGKEAAYQPLSQFGYFTKTQTVKPMASIGAGVKYRIGERLFLRVEFRDFITAFPKEVITPPPGVKYGTLLHDFVPMAGISYEF
jgi:hypothetical protein